MLTKEIIDAETFLANLKYAVRNQEQVNVAGGIFNTEEIKSIIAVLEKGIASCQPSVHTK